MGDVRINAKSTLSTINRWAVVSVANPKLDGTGTIVNILTPGNLPVQIDSITIKATGSTTQGMIRLFLNDGTTTFLYTEIPVAAIVQSGTTEAFSASFSETISLEVGWSLAASTENAEDFNIFVDAFEVSFCKC